MRKGKALAANILDSHLSFALVSILLGLAFGAIVLAAVGLSPVEAYTAVFEGIFSQPRFLMRVVINAVPIIMTGLAVAFAFKAGLFNIGAEGQFLLGSLAAVSIGVFVQAPPVILPILCIAGGAVAGAFLGTVTGALKAVRGVHEVISCILLNWSALYFANYILLNTPLKHPISDASVNIQEAAMINLNWANWGITAETAGPMGAFFRAMGPATPVNAGILVAIAAVIVVYIIINKTTLGFKLRAVGLNSHASLYGGISVTRSVVTSMAISGAMAGIGGALLVTGVQHRINLLVNMEGYGFDGLAVSMIGANNPFGVLLAGFFFSGLRLGSGRLMMMGAPSELIDIIMGSIIYFVAISNAVRLLYLYLRRRKGAGA